MENKGTKKLIMVTADNNNKFYNMKDNGDGTFKVEWGRVGVTSSETTYPISKWDSIYRQKTKKGYKDITEIFVEAGIDEETSFADITNTQISKLVNALQSYAKGSVKKNYLVTSENVTQKQVDEAQNIIDQITSESSQKNVVVENINDLLTDLYSIIPRRMSNVRMHLFNTTEGMNFSSDNVNHLIANEQATLDVMAGQVSTIAKTKTVDHKEEKTLLDAMGITIEQIDAKDKETIMQLLGSNARQFRNAYRVTNLATQSRYDKWVEKSKDKRAFYFWHGSRNENWWSILDTGLVLRPSNAVITGKMFGYGLYFADKAQKSIGYTSLRGSYWASGSANKAYLAVFQVHTGNWLHFKTHEYWMYDLNEKNLKSRGSYDSLFAEGGADLRNNEYIVYNQAQCSVKYLVEIGD